MFVSQKTLLVLGILALWLGFSQADFTKSIIDQAMKKPQVSYQKGTGSSPSVVGAAHAWYYLTLVASINPEATSNDGKSVKDRVISTFKNLVSGSKEPHCSNPLYGWSDGAIALSLALIKKTPSLWNSLSSDDHNKADWLMKALGIAGNWAFNDNNKYKTGLGKGGNFGKDFNPNFIQGYMGVMTAFSLYFGADEGNKVFTSFNYDTYMNQFKTYNWSNIRSNWEKTGKSSMESGGSDGLGGSGKGVKQEFKWNGHSLSDLNGIYHSQSVSGAPKPMYSKTVVNSVGAARLLSGSSPVLGQLGMCLEFDTSDSNGVRSDALYALEGWMNSLITRATMKKLGVWQPAAQVEKQMLVGTTDLMYKLSKGYQGINLHGNYVTNDAPGGGADQKGYLFQRDIWINYVNK